MKAKPQTCDAQLIKAALEKAAKKIGKRKRLTAAQLFQLIVDCAA